MKETILPETRFGLLTTKELTKNKEGKKAWRCLCDCGNEKIVRDTDLKLGKVKTCGYQCPLRYTISGRAIDETGKVYGRLTVIKRIPPQKGDKRVFGSVNVLVEIIRMFQQKIYALERLHLVVV